VPAKSHPAQNHGTRRVRGDYFLKGSAVVGAAYIAGSPAFSGSMPVSVIVVVPVRSGLVSSPAPQRGAKVTLLDAWGPGNSRASSWWRNSHDPRHVWSYARHVREDGARALLFWQEVRAAMDLKIIPFAVALSGWPVRTIPTKRARFACVARSWCSV